MKRIQAIKSFFQDHTCKVSTPQIANHHAHLMLYAICPMYQEVSWKNAQVESIKIVGMWSIGHRDSLSRKVRKN